MLYSSIILGTGVDLCYGARILKVVESLQGILCKKHCPASTKDTINMAIDKFFKKIANPVELNYLYNLPQFLSRDEQTKIKFLTNYFCIKEALIKALKGMVGFLDITLIKYFFCLQQNSYFKVGNPIQNLLPEPGNKPQTYHATGNYHLLFTPKLVQTLLQSFNFLKKTSLIYMDQHNQRVLQAGAYKKFKTLLRCHVSLSHEQICTNNSAATLTTAQVILDALLLKKNL